MSRRAISAGLAALALGFGACGGEDAEQRGRDAAGQAEDAARDAGEKAEEAAKDARRKAEEAKQDAEDAAGGGY